MEEINARRALKAFIYVMLAAFIFSTSYTENLSGYTDPFILSIKHYAEDHGYKEVDVESGAAKTMYVLSLVFIVYSFAGIYFMYYYKQRRNMPLEISFWDLFKKHEGESLAESEIQPGELQYIEDMKKFRDSMLAGEKSSQAAEDFVKTAWLDSVENLKGPHARRAARYVNSRLASMSNTEGYKWLKGEK